ncbi:MAG: hypothetical protein JXQ97_12900 [Natronospirillum sp.]
MGKVIGIKAPIVIGTEFQDRDSVFRGQPYLMIDQANDSGIIITEGKAIN